MNKFVLLVLIGSLALVTEGCSFFSEFSDASKELEKETAKPIPAQVNRAQTTPKETELFADLESESEVEALPEIAGLIPATDPEARVRSRIRGRNDPFSILTLNPQIKIDREKQKASNTTVSRGRTSNPIENPTPRNNNGPQSDLSDVPQPKEVEVFKPTLAQNVVISGLFEADGRTRIIVQAPEESSSRYVEEGQYLSNGQILVKRIDKDHFPSPMIILEQSGVEVAKTIGSDLNDENRISSLPTGTPNNNWETSISLK